MRDDEEFLTLTSAARTLGVSRPTLGEIIRREGLRSYESRLNRRVRLLLAEDVRALKERALKERELSVA